jgi:Cft2 family RNA processing exonuclease
MIEYNNGISIEGLDFVLDAGRRAECSFVSHAHSDHARKHKKIIATPETALLYRHRYPTVPTRAIPFGHRTKIGSASVELFPSGHMLGAAQIMVDIKSTRIVYTGDFKVYPNLTCPPLETRHCDILIMESTYGDPTYRFPPQNEVYTRIIMFIKRCFADGKTPVLVGYATGKAQEAVLLAQQHGFDVCVDSAVGEVNDLYRSAGVKLRPTPNWHRCSLTGKALVVSPQTIRSDSYKRMRRLKSVFLTGWAQGEGMNRYTSADWSLPLSDHADYTQLLHYIEMSDPAKIYTLHGDPKFARILVDIGYDAEYLGKGSTAKPLSHGKAEKPRKLRAGQNYELF